MSFPSGGLTRQKTSSGKVDHHTGGKLSCSGNIIYNENNDCHFWLVDVEGRTVELNSPVGSVPYIKPNYLLQFEFMLGQTITENSQLILVGPNPSGLDVSFFHMFYNGTTIYIGADAIGSNMFADQSPFYFNINLELNKWYKLVCSQVIDYLTAVLVM